MGILGVVNLETVIGKCMIEQTRLVPYLSSEMGGWAPLQMEIRVIFTKENLCPALGPKLGEQSILLYKLFLICLQLKTILDNTKVACFGVAYSHSLHWKS